MYHNILLLIFFELTSILISSLALELEVPSPANNKNSILKKIINMYTIILIKINIYFLNNINNK